MIKQNHSITNEQPCSALERDLVINGTHIRVRSIFNGQVPLEKALGNLVQRRISESK
ncbi:MAG: hypothetical protein FWE28_03515 [Oscillospiraceae bacterium]|nr:hypothetical protein [Oscillospiraceae bacterium]